MRTHTRSPSSPVTIIESYVLATEKGSNKRIRKNVGNNDPYCVQYDFASCVTESEQTGLVLCFLGPAPVVS